jgi:hypothetical protein
MSRNKLTLKTSTYLKLLCITGVLCLAIGCQTTGKWQSLFNGENLEGWNVHGEPDTWYVENDQIVGELTEKSGYSYLVTERVFNDFDLKLEALFESEKGNSGIFFRSTFPPYCPKCEYNVFRDLPETAQYGQCEKHGRVKAPPYQMRAHIHGPQAEFAPPSHFTGGIYDAGGGGWVNKDQATPARKQAHKFQEWNTMRIKAVGDHVEVWLNSMKISDITEHDFAEEGKIALQLHAGGKMQVRFRNLRIREIPEHEVEVDETNQCRTEVY